MPASPAIRSRADVATGTPARYAKQLVSHLGHKIEITTDGDTSRIQLSGATGSIVPGDDALTLLAEGPDEAAVVAVEDVLGRHLEHFGRRDELVVTWTRTSADGHA